MEKSANAYRNIREASEILGLEAHVLRFWESRIDKLQPMTRGGGRRFYSPADIELIEVIKTLLHGRGITMKAANNLINSHGLDALEIYDQAAHQAGAPSRNPDRKPHRQVHLSRLTAFDQRLVALQRQIVKELARLEEKLAV